MDGGVLRTFVSDVYWGRRLGMVSTGNASGGGGVAANNFYLAPGSGTLDDLVASTERGVLVLDTIGFATEFASGTYSRGARGIYIEDGTPQYAIDEFTIASTFGDMLAGIDGYRGRPALRRHDRQPVVPRRGDDDRRNLTPTRSVASRELGDCAADRRRAQLERVRADHELERAHARVRRSREVLERDHAA